MNYPEYCYLCDENIKPTPEGFITHIESARHNLMFEQKVLAIKNNIIPDELLLVDLRAYLLNEISSLYLKLRDIRTIDPPINITQQTVRMRELINTWKKYFKDEPYLMRVTVVDATHHDLWWSP